jgi:transcriptional regulator with XRE-family HTH domain
MARPTSYTDDIPRQAEIVIALGATDKNIADVFGVTERTINNWERKHPEFFQSLKEAKNEYDAEIEKSLALRAKGGYETTETRTTTNSDDGLISKVTVTKTLAPDTTAAIFWLKNRQPERWRDKPSDSGGSESIAEAMSKLADVLPN